MLALSLPLSLSLHCIGRLNMLPSAYLAAVAAAAAAAAVAAPLGEPSFPTSRS